MLKNRKGTLAVSSLAILSNICVTAQSSAALGSKKNKSENRSVLVSDGSVRDKNTLNDNGKSKEKKSKFSLKKLIFSLPGYITAGCAAVGALIKYALERNNYGHRDDYKKSKEGLYSLGSIIARNNLDTLQDMVSEAKKSEYYDTVRRLVTESKLNNNGEFPEDKFTGSDEDITCTYRGEHIRRADAWKEILVPLLGRFVEKDYSTYKRNKRGESYFSAGGNILIWESPLDKLRKENYSGEYTELASKILENTISSYRLDLSSEDQMWQLANRAFLLDEPLRLYYSLPELEENCFTVPSGKHKGKKLVSSDYTFSPDKKHKYKVELPTREFINTERTNGPIELNYKIKDAIIELAKKKDKEQYHSPFCPLFSKNCHPYEDAITYYFSDTDYFKDTKKFVSKISNKVSRINLTTLSNFNNEEFIELIESGRKKEGKESYFKGRTYFDLNRDYAELDRVLKKHHNILKETIEYFGKHLKPEEANKKEVEQKKDPSPNKRFSWLPW